ncbi:MAG TPA: HD domain-containing phosphohydrolase [Actinomycetota bacterium]|nr:HD domain-containing phosphohydrolase [Actinomycetota bacterium]
MSRSLSGAATLGAVTRALRRPGAALGRGGAGFLVLLLVVPTAATLALRAIPRLDLAFESVTFHLIVVSGIAAFALVVALFTAAVAARQRRAEPVLLAAGCLFVGAFMLGHGLTTPGIWGRPVNMWVARFPVLALAGFAACMFLATTRGRHGVKRLAERRPGAVLSLAAASMSALTLVLVVRPSSLAGGQPVPGESILTHLVAVGAGSALIVAGAVHWRRWRLGLDRIELALVLACWLSADAVVSFELGTLWRLSWWDYHAYLLAGFAAAAWAVVAEAGRIRSPARALASISMVDPLEHIARGNPEALNALTAAVEVKDRYTHGHSARVAELSTRIGDRIGLGPDELRRLAQGALLHDIGKIGVPDGVLNKPGPLEEGEWKVIQSHPVVGWEVASRAPSLKAALSVVRHHHERWDGSGYPDGLGGADIPLAARIAAVADVWDALTSDRAYRPAWPVDQAISHIAGAAGSLFDPLCVEALCDLAMVRGLTPERTDLDLEALVAAARACHPRMLADQSSPVR